jgi:23S rRNA pseudouridine955/2504/2580 synthase/23S rRNA pseudouridine1911/1915/1917 synthase
MKRSSDPRRAHGGRPGRAGAARRDGAPRRDGPPHGGARRSAGPPQRATPGAPAPRFLRPPDKAPLWKPGRDARMVRAEAGLDLAHFVQKQHPHLSVRAARALIDGGHCRVNGRVETFGSRKLAVGDVVEAFLREEHEHTFDPRRILFERDGVIAYDKPAWLPVARGDSPKDWSLTDILRTALGPVTPGHRLDADTSGIVLFAREERVARRLEELFRDHAVQKTYHALVRGHPRESGTHRSYLVQVKKGRGFERWESGRGADAREAITTWEVEHLVGAYGALVRVEPKSGRHHQIRIHFSEMGHPIYGDRLYGDRADPIQIGRHLLHASAVKLPHPAGGHTIELESRLPREFALAEAMLRKL